MSAAGFCEPPGRAPLSGWSAILVLIYVEAESARLDRPHNIRLRLTVPRGRRSFQAAMHPGSATLSRIITVEHAAVLTQANGKIGPLTRGAMHRGLSGRAAPQVSRTVRQTRVILRIEVLAALALVAIGCASSRVLHDSDGNPYTVKVMSDGRAWTTNNLRLVLPGSYCHGDAASQCLRFGRLYTWPAAVQVCSRLGTGWRLPTDDEWRQLAKGYGGLLGDSEGGEAPTDLLAGRSSGFNAVLGGNREVGGSYTRLDAHGFYWTATESDNEHAWFYNFGRLGLNRHRGGDKSMAVSVRCIEGR